MDKYLCFKKIYIIYLFNILLVFKKADPGLPPDKSHLMHRVIVYMCFHNYIFNVNYQIILNNIFCKKIVWIHAKKIKDKVKSYLIHIIIIIIITVNPHKCIPLGPDETVGG